MKTVAVVGASRDRRKFGNKAVRGFLHAGCTVVPIYVPPEIGERIVAEVARKRIPVLWLNPHDDEIEGLRSYPSVLDFPLDIDMATFYVPPEIGERIVDEVARKRIPVLWLNPGSDGPGVVRRAREVGLEPTVGCSLVAHGESPARY